jgi:3-hydroxymyristoyl/3-hydroxydecanoyl-(acyl carrier protein) dehydratase
MPLDPAFVEDCPYGPGALLIDEIVEVDRAASRVRALMHTTADLPITRDQRAHPVRHPRHVSGGLMVHVTGIMGFAHAYYVLDLRHAEGWIGYGTHIHKARFRKMASIGAPLHLDIRASDLRKIRGNVFARYELRFTQEDEIVYEGDQSAVFTRVAADVTPETIRRDRAS